MRLLTLFVSFGVLLRLNLFSTALIIDSRDLVSLLTSHLHTLCQMYIISHSNLFLTPVVMDSGGLVKSAHKLPCTVLVECTAYAALKSVK